MERYIIYYFTAINVTGFLLFTIDKRKAQINRYRISESWLLFVCLFGGSLGGLLAMGIFKHKTKKAKFTIGLPILLLFNFLTWYYLSSLFL